jgi:hypothetical protein
MTLDEVAVLQAVLHVSGRIVSTITICCRASIHSIQDIFTDG